jgi:Zn-dependent protease
MSLVRKIGLALITLVAFYFSFYLILGPVLAMMITVSVGLHEVGHALMFARYGMRTKMFFIPLLGAAVSPDDVAAFDNMDWRKMAYVALSGPLVNVALLIASLLLAISAENRSWAIQFASLNAALAAFNLIPFSILDGGRFAKALFSSLHDSKDRMVAYGVSGIAIMIAMAMLVNGRIGLLSGLIVLGIHRKARKYSPDVIRHKRMTEEEAMSTLYMYAALLIVAGFTLAFLPNWI